MPPLWKAIHSFFTDSPAASANGRPATPIVALLKGDGDRDLLSSVGAREHLDIHFVRSCGEAWNTANRLKSPLILCDRDIPGIEWQDEVRMLASAASHPCVILISRVVDDYLWKEIVARGGYDVLATPLREEDVTRSIRLALSYWKNTPRAQAPEGRK